MGSRIKALEVATDEEKRTLYPAAFSEFSDNHGDEEGYKIDLNSIKGNLLYVKIHMEFYDGMANG